MIHDEDESLNWSPGVKLGWLPDDSTRRYDLIGRKIPRRLTPAVLVSAIPGLGAQLSRISGSAWSQDVNVDDITVAEVACPCGQAPRIEVGCSEICACGRYFAYDGETVWVGNSPVRNA